MKYDFLGERARKRGRLTIYETEENGHRRQFISDEHAIYAVDDKAETDEIFDLFGVGDERTNIPVKRVPMKNHFSLLPSTEHDKPASLVDFCLFHMATETQLCLFTSEYGLMAFETMLFRPFLDDKVEFFARADPKAQSSAAETVLVVKAGNVLEAVIRPIDNSFLLQAPVRRMVDALTKATADQLVLKEAVLPRPKKDGE